MCLTIRRGGPYVVDGLVELCREAPANAMVKCLEFVREKVAPEWAAAFWVRVLCDLSAAVLPTASGVLVAGLAGVPPDVRAVRGIGAQLRVAGDPAAVAGLRRAIIVASA
jgi:hypothetical protein